MTENASSINDRVFVIISEQLGVQKETLTLTSSFAEDLGADSLDTIELIMRFEEEFGVRIPDEHVEKLTTISDVIEYVKANS